MQNLLKLIHKIKIIDRFVSLVMIISSGFLMVFLAQTETKPVIVVLVLVLVAIQVFTMQPLLRKEYRWSYFFFPVIEYILIIVIFLGSNTGIEGIVLVLFTIRMTLLHPTLPSVIFLVIGYVLYLYILAGFDSGLGDILIMMLEFSILVTSVIFQKLLIKQRETILQLNKKLLLQSNAMEEMAMIEERNRIAEDMHNTIGHTLTTAIVSIESANVLIAKDIDEAKIRLSIARDQLKKGLGDIRQVVKQLRYESNPKFKMNLKQLINELIEKIHRQTPINIYFSYCVNVELLSLQNYVIYNIVKEGITNAIKHADANSISIDIDQSEDVVIVNVINDCKENEILKEGFGLKTMIERVEAIGGKLTYTNGDKDNPTFVLTVFLPIASEVNYENY